MNTETETDAPGLPLLEHLVELRRRLIYSLLAVLAGFVVSYVFAQDIYEFLVQPLAYASGEAPRRLIYTGLAEAFTTYIQLALWTGCFLAFPIVAAQIWMFVAPGLYKNERRAFLPFLIATPIFFLLGAAMAYFVVFPMAWRFFLSFEVPAAAGGLPIQLEARVSEYLALSMSVIFGFGVAFELPVVLVLLARAGILSAEKLSSFRRYAIVLIFAGAAVLTPPDVISMMSLALPMVLLYELAIWGARWVGKKDTDLSEDVDQNK